jgi:plasmid replication initiation protein
MEEKKTTLYQPNIITQARYSFSEYEMRVLLFVVRSIQDKLNRNDLEFQKNLFGEIHYRVQFYLADLLGDGEKKQDRIKKALADLRAKSFEVDTKEIWFNTGFINHASHKKSINKWELEVSYLLMPYMVSLAKGFTTYQLETVLLLNSNSQRLYMMFSQFHDTGIFKITAEDLRYKLGLENKYNQYLDLKKAVIIRGLKEIKALFDTDKADIWVKLESDKKTRGKEDFDRLLVFKIYFSQRKTQQIETAKADTLRYCTEILKSILPTDNRFSNMLLGYLVGKKRLKAFADRLEKIEDQALAEGKPLSSYGGLVRHIANKDFGFKS